VRTNDFVNHGDLPLWEAINCSNCSLRTPPVCNNLCWQSSSQLWIDSHPIACWFWFLLHPVLRTFLKCTSWVIFSVATIAASWWTNCCLCCCCVSPSSRGREVPVVRLDGAAITPGGSHSGVVLATGPGNPPAVQVWTGKAVPFGSRTVQKPDPQLLGGPNPDPYPSTRGFCRVWLDPSVRISGSSFRVFLFMVAFSYPTVLCKILTLVHHCLCSIDWLPLWSKQAETCRLLHHEVECERFFVLQH